MKRGMVVWDRPVALTVGQGWHEGEDWGSCVHGAPGVSLWGLLTGEFLQLKSLKIQCRALNDGRVIVIRSLIKSCLQQRPYIISFSENYTFQDIKFNSNSPNYNQAVDRNLALHLLAGNIFLSLVFQNKRYVISTIFNLEASKNCCAVSHIILIS